MVDPAIIALIHSFELPNEEARRAQAEDRSVSSIVQAALKAYVEGGGKAR